MAQAARFRGEAERAGRDRAGMEEVYLSLKQGVETETETLKAKFDELQARVFEADAKRDQVGMVWRRRMRFFEVVGVSWFVEGANVCSGGRFGGGRCSGEG